MQDGIFHLGERARMRTLIVACCFFTFYGKVRMRGAREYTSLYTRGLWGTKWGGAGR